METQLLDNLVMGSVLLRLQMVPDNCSCQWCSYNRIINEPRNVIFKGHSKVISFWNGRAPMSEWVHLGSYAVAMQHPRRIQVHSEVSCSIPIDAFIVLSIAAIPRFTSESVFPEGEEATMKVKWFEKHFGWFLIVMLSFQHQLSTINHLIISKTIRLLFERKDIPIRLCLRLVGSCPSVLSPGATSLTVAKITKDYGGLLSQLQTPSTKRKSCLFPRSTPRSAGWLRQWPQAQPRSWRRFWCASGSRIF